MSPAEVSGHLVGSAAFKAVGTGDPRPAGSIPVHLRRARTPDRSPIRRGDAGPGFDVLAKRSTVSSFVQTTVVPTGTVMSAGSNEMSTIETSTVSASSVDADVVSLFALDATSDCAVVAAEPDVVSSLRSLR